MKEISDAKKQLLKEAYGYCNTNDKSTEFMLEYMQSVADVDLDTVLEYIQSI